MTSAPEFIEISDPSALPAEPLVSVHMLTYRHAPFIAQAIEGVLAQKVDFPIELIIAEDCSPDETRAIALDYQRRRPDVIRVLTLGRNVGMLANARRLALANRGQYIAACEGDDYWHHPHKLQMQMDMMRGDPEMVLCHTDYDRRIGRRQKKGRHSRKRQSRVAANDAYVDLLHEWTVMTATTVYRADVVRNFQSSPFNRQDWPFGDYNLALFASLRGRVGYIPVSTATWRKVLNSASNAGFIRTLRLRLADLECKEMFMAHYSVEEGARRSVLWEAHQIIVRDAFYAGDEAAYRRSYEAMKAMGKSPGHMSHWLRKLAMQLVFPLRAVQFFKSAMLVVTTQWL